MNQLNQIILEGNCASNLTVSESSAGIKTGNLIIEVNRHYKNRNGETVEEVSSFDVEVYGEMAEVLSSKLSKGRGVRLVGRLKQKMWKDSDGKQHIKVVVLAEHIEIKPQFKKEAENVCN